MSWIRAACNKGAAYHLMSRLLHHAETEVIAGKRGRPTYVAIWREDKGEARLVEVIEKLLEVRFRGTQADLVKLRRMARALKVKDVIEWELGEKELYDLEEVSPELVWNSGGVAIRGARGKEGLTQKQLAELTGIAQHHGSWTRPWQPASRRIPSCAFAPGAG